MDKQFLRTEMLFGTDNMKILKEKKVIIFGIGGVGGYVVEALARSGIYNFTLVDNDVVDITNINRQIIATLDSVGKNKVDVMKDRILSINKEATVKTEKMFYLPDNSNYFDFKEYDYIIDCIDTISAKINLVVKAKEANVPIICAMGAGNKIDATMLEVEDLAKTSVDPIAKVMRYELKKYDIRHVKVVYSKEEPYNQNMIDSNGRHIPASNAFVPTTMGIIIASEVIKDLINIKK